MLRRIVCLAVVTVIIVGPALAQPQQLIFKKVDYYWVEGEDEKDEDARLVLDPANKTMGFYDEKNGAAKRTFAVIPYDKITSMTYEKSSHSRIAMGLLLSPLAFLMKGKKHWLTVQAPGVPGLSAGYVYVRMDKGNFQQILAAVEAQTGVKVERLEEQ